MKPSDASKKLLRSPARPPSSPSSPRASPNTVPTLAMAFVRASTPSYAFQTRFNSSVAASIFSHCSAKALSFFE